MVLLEPSFTKMDQMWWGIKPHVVAHNKLSWPRKFSAFLNKEDAMIFFEWVKLAIIDDRHVLLQLFPCLVEDVLRPPGDIDGAGLDAQCTKAALFQEA